MDNQNTSNAQQPQQSNGPTQPPSMPNNGHAAEQPSSAPNPGAVSNPVSGNDTPPPAPTTNTAVAPPPDTSYPQNDSGDGSPKAYLVKYFLSLLITGTLIALVISFFSSIVDSLGAESADSGWTAQFAYQSSLGKVSVAIVFGAALWLLAKQCYATEKAFPAIKTNRWRKGFLGVFLILLGIAALSAGATLVYNIVSLIASMGITYIDGAETTKSIVNNVFATTVLTLTAILYAQDFASGKMSALMRNMHHYGLLISIVVLTVLFAALPLQAQRDSFIDHVTSDDIEALQNRISRYTTDEGELPENLSDLELSDGLKKRVDNYEYTTNTSSYEICAEFRTDTTEAESSSGNPLEDMLGGSLYPDDSSREDDPTYHEEGRECFEFEAYGIDRFDSFNSDEFFNQQNSSRQGEEFNTTGQTN